jgi:hypothetical protein
MYALFLTTTFFYILHSMDRSIDVGVEGSIRRPERGEWMGADKHSSPKRELDLCPKFTTNDSHTSLPRSRSHNRPTNPRNKPQTIPKQKLDSRSKGLSCPANHQADRPRGSGGPSARCGGLSEKRSRTSRRCYTYEFVSSNPLNKEESRFYRAQTQS